jgi:hypothetical protein
MLKMVQRKSRAIIDVKKKKPGVTPGSLFLLLTGRLRTGQSEDVTDRGV